MVTVTCPSDFSLPVSRFLADSGFRPTTRATYECALKSFYGWCTGAGISLPTTVDVNHWRDFLLARYALATAQTYLTVVKLFFCWTALQGYYPDVAYGVRKIRLGKVQSRDFLPAADIKHILQSLKDCGQYRDYVMVSLMVTCGLRVSEVYHLDINDLFCIGRQHLLRIHGKGRDGKSDCVAVSEAMAKLLQKYLSWRQQTLKTDDALLSPMFVSAGRRCADGRLRSRSVSRIVKQALRRAGFDSPRLTAHSLRHTAVTLALIGGASLQQAQQYARHRRIETTQIYAHNQQSLS